MNTFHVVTELNKLRRNKMGDSLKFSRINRALEKANDCILKDDDNFLEALITIKKELRVDEYSHQQENEILRKAMGVIVSAEAFDLGALK